MAIFKCKMCGGSLEINEDSTVAVCEYCGSKQTLPKFDNEKKNALNERANHFRQNYEYDKALSLYEQILNEDISDAESYWSIVLCRYGIEYVEDDPITHKRIPTINRMQYTSILNDADYLSALQYADTTQKVIYEEEAKQINDIQKGVLEISAKEEPFDIFICYKETDKSGKRTHDSVTANEMYHQLTNEGYRVFFARISLEDQIGSAYEPYIFAALNSAKIMIVIGSKEEYFNAPWVKNEWSRFLSLIKKGEKKTLIPAYKDMDPYDLPAEFAHLQAQDMGKLGFMQDLIRGINKILPKKTEPEQNSHDYSNMVTHAVESVPTINSLLKRVEFFLEDSDYESAEIYIEKILDIDPTNAKAYYLAFLSNKKLTPSKVYTYVLESANTNLNRAIKYAKDEFRKELLSINYTLKKNKKIALYYIAMELLNRGEQETAFDILERIYKNDYITQLICSSFERYANIGNMCSLSIADTLIEFINNASDEEKACQIIKNAKLNLAKEIINSNSVFYELTPDDSLHDNIENLSNIFSRQGVSLNNYSKDEIDQLNNAVYFNNLITKPRKILIGISSPLQSKVRSWLSMDIVSYDISNSFATIQLDLCDAIKLLKSISDIPEAQSRLNIIVSAINAKLNSILYYKNSISPSELNTAYLLISNLEAAGINYMITTKDIVNILQQQVKNHKNKLEQQHLRELKRIEEERERTEKEKQLREQRLQSSMIKKEKHKYRVAVIFTMIYSLLCAVSMFLLFIVDKWWIITIIGGVELIILPLFFRNNIIINDSDEVLSIVMTVILCIIETVQLVFFNINFVNAGLVIGATIALFAGMVAASFFSFDFGLGAPFSAPIAIGTATSILSFFVDLLKDVQASGILDSIISFFLGIIIAIPSLIAAAILLFINGKIID